MAIFFFFKSLLSYVCWSFARAYEPAVLAEHISVILVPPPLTLQALSVALVVAALFDREVNCRRAASAALQEHVGRQGVSGEDGGGGVPHGLEVLHLTDYFTLGNRAAAFVTVAADVAKWRFYF